jgi:hypothetical protein
MLLAPNLDDQTEKHLSLAGSKFTRNVRVAQILDSPDSVRRQHEVFVLSLHDIVNWKPHSGMKLTTAVPAGSRVLARRSDEAVAAHLTVSKVDGSLRISGLTDLSQSLDTQIALQVLDAFSQAVELQATDYKAATLRVPGLLIEAYWFRCNEPTWPDWVLPFQGPDEKLLDKRFYSMDEFMGVLKDLAEKRLQYDDKPSPEPAA